jgi:plasmid stability protein
MEITLELPDALVKQVNLRAIRDGRKLKDAVADLLRKGLAAEAGTVSGRPVVRTDKATALPIIDCLHAAPPDDEMTAERAADILLAQDSD